MEAQRKASMRVNGRRWLHSAEWTRLLVSANTYDRKYKLICYTLRFEREGDREKEKDKEQALSLLLRLCVMMEDLRDVFNVFDGGANSQSLFVRCCAKDCCPSLPLPFLSAQPGLVHIYLCAAVGE